MQYQDLFNEMLARVRNLQTGAVGNDHVLINETKKALFDFSDKLIHYGFIYDRKQEATRNGGNDER